MYSFNKADRNQVNEVKKLISILIMPIVCLSLHDSTAVLRTHEITCDI